MSMPTSNNNEQSASSQTTSGELHPAHLHNGDVEPESADPDPQADPQAETGEDAGGDPEEKEEDDEHQQFLDGDEHPSRARHRKVTRKIYFITAMGSLGGFLAGYQSGVFSSAMIPIDTVFDLTSDEKKIVLSSSVLAAVLGSIVGAFLNNRFGRQKTILIGAPTMALGTKLQAVGWNYVSMAAGRSLEGFGLGIIYLTVHIYVAEMAVPSQRGQLVMFGSVMLYIGQWLAESIDDLIEKYFPEFGWRLMFGLACLPSLIILIGFFFLPETPRWLALKGRKEEALKVLKTIRLSDEEAEEELTQILEKTPYTPGLLSDHGSNREDFGDEDENERGKPVHEKSAAQLFCELFADHAARRALVLVCGLYLLQELGGLHTVLYYGAFIYEQVGFNRGTAIWLSSFTPLLLVAGVLLSTALIDRLGRRILSMTSLFLIGLSLIGLAGVFATTKGSSEPVIYSIGPCISRSTGFFSAGESLNSLDCASMDGCGFCDGICAEGNETGPYNSKQCPSGEWMGTNVIEGIPDLNGAVAVLLMATYLVAYGFGLAGLPRTFDSEVYPLEYRSMASGFSNAIYWMSNLVASSTFISPGKSSMLVYSETFWFYGVVSLLGFVWICCSMPETKALSLEEIEDVLHRDREGSQVIEETDENDEEEGDEGNSSGGGGGDNTGEANSELLPLQIP